MATNRTVDSTMDKSRGLGDTVGIFRQIVRRYEAAADRRYGVKLVFGKFGSGVDFHDVTNRIMQLQSHRVKPGSPISLHGGHSWRSDNGESETSFVHGPEVAVNRFVTLADECGLYIPERLVPTKPIFEFAGRAALSDPARNKWLAYILRQVVPSNHPCWLGCPHIGPFVYELDVDPFTYFAALIRSNVLPQLVSASKKDSKRPRVVIPSNKAIKAYRLQLILGVPSQIELAKRLTAEGIPATQGQVSRWIKVVEAFIRAGNVLPDPAAPASRAKAMDPRVLDMGKRPDGRSVRQRPKPSE